MINCQSLNKDPCPYCCGEKESEKCWILFYREYLDGKEINILDKEILFNLFKKQIIYNENTNDNGERTKYFSIAIELYFPEYLELFNKIKLLK
jgi:hypothetical protein